ncbi:MAG: MBG-2 domain-containing protein [Chloroflexi bacterium]|nr:MBG-2 domain-containing protein [Chloroflexota bacterium]
MFAGSFAPVQAASSSSDYSILHSAFLSGGNRSVSGDFTVDVSLGDFGGFVQSADGSSGIWLGHIGQFNLLVPAVTWALPSAITYGTPLSSAQLNATAGVGGVFEYVPQAGAILNAGQAQTLSATFTPTDTTTYALVSVTVPIDVHKAALTITAENKFMRQGEALPTFTATYAGFVSGDTPANLSTPPTLTTTATSASPAGSYPITGSGAVGANYTISYVSGTLTVTAFNVQDVISQLRWEADGFHFVVTVPAGHEARVEVSENLKDWNRFTPQPITGQAHLQDLSSPTLRLRFYRVIID